ncbi:MAG: molybdopterin-dependent oxidoreductase [Clostridiales bacterium]|nr:molybdopterin-dependent oxidoreductase [Clostridiales bacterium]
MNYITKKIYFKKGLALFMALALIFSSMGIVYADSWNPKTEQPVVVITGTGVGLTNEKSYTQSELNAMPQATNLYSTINTTPTKSIYLGKGVKVKDLFAKSGFGADKYNNFKIGFIAKDGYTVTFDPGHKGDSTTSKKLITPSFGAERYYFPKIATGDSSGKAVVDTILSFEEAGERGNPGVIPTASSLEKLPDSVAPHLMVGQQHVEEMSNPLFNKTIQKILVGEELAPAISIGGKDYTRAEILLMPRTTGNWSYNTKGGLKTDYCVGVPLVEILKGYKDNDKVEFISADGYPNEPLTIKDIKNSTSQYILVYEIGENASDVKAVYDTAKNDPSIEGYFRIYNQEGSLLKLINEIKVIPAGGTDYTVSPFKHITNGGLSGKEPYNVDAITGATLTFEGPGLEASIPLSVREAENQNAGAHRGDYTDVRDGKATTFKYEGIRLDYLLRNMTSGETGIKLTNSAYKVLIKNRVRQTVAEFTLDEIKQAEASKKPIIVAYGTGSADGSKAMPFVYDGEPGKDPALDNDDGCIKLVYDKSVFAKDPNPGYIKFGNMAYIYVAEKVTPGYKHDKAPYVSPENSEYVITITGDKLGREVNYTVKEIEDMVKYENGLPAAGGMGYRAEYNLSNSNYWYVNEYEGVKLWDLLKKAGIPESMSKGTDSQTLVEFTATDGYKDFDKFTLAQISNPNLFKYYEKNPLDLNDGKYISKDADDLRATGFPVLVAYGVNGYPYVIKNTLDGYKSGLGNDGGPVRIIYGKTEYYHANGSKQAKLLDKIIVGKEINYSTHSQNPNKTYNALAANKISVTVIGMDGSTLKKQDYTIKDIENMIYGSDVKNTEKVKAKVKSIFAVKKGDNVYEDLYEGVNLEYFLKEKVAIPGSKGTVIFANGDSELKVSLDVISAAKDKSMLAFAKNGSPMVADKNAEGYVNNYTDGSGDKINVKNDGGPLMALMPNAKTLNGVTSITINLHPDKYAHIDAPYKDLAGKTIVFEGPGTRLAAPKTFKVSDIEGKQNLVITADYNIKKATSESKIRYRGIDLYSFLRSEDIGLQSNASEIIVTASDGKTHTFPLADVMNTDLKMILAYGSSSVDNNNPDDGKPLVESKDSKGYDAVYGNSGGPLYLILGQKSADDMNSQSTVKDVVKITVNASAVSSWKHDMSPTYSQYLDTTFLELEGTALAKSVKFSLRELEAMDDVIHRDSYFYIGEHQHEGLNVWKLISEKAGLKIGVELTSVKVVASDGFSRDLLSVFGKDALEKGIADGLDRKIILLSYAGDGVPLVTDTNSDGYTSGNDGGPLRLITHQNQGACLKNVVKFVVEGTGGTIPVDTKTPFGDVVGHWAEEHILYLYDKGVTNGTGPNTYSPNNTLTRAEFVKFIISTKKDIDVKGAKDIFKDVAKGEWYTEYVNWAGENGVDAGSADGSFRPGDVITREEMATMLLSFADAAKIKLPRVSESMEFVDATKISPWAEKAIGIVQRAGIIEGKPGDIFDPKGSADRASAAKIIKLLMDIIDAM